MVGPPVTQGLSDPGTDPRPPLVMRSRAALPPAALVAVCCVLAAAVLAAAVGATHGTPSGSAHTSGWAYRLVVDVVAAVEVLVVVAIIGTVALVIMSGGIGGAPDQRPVKRRSWKQALVFATCVAVALALAHSTPRSSRRPAAPARPAPQIASPSTVPTPSTRTAKPDWGLVIALLGLAGAAVVVASWHNSTRARQRARSAGVEPPEPASGPPTSAITNAVRAGLRDLAAETDPRRAVILSYGAMEASFAQAGHGRRRSEAPIEYLTRMLLVEGVSAHAVTALTTLFEQAGFSAGPISDDDRRAALDALRRVDDELSAKASR
jgi:hypothetical protein